MDSVPTLIRSFIWHFRKSLALRGNAGQRRRYLGAAVGTADRQAEAHPAKLAEPGFCWCRVVG
jgi:hypothetical protein